MTHLISVPLTMLAALIAFPNIASAEPSSCYQFKIEDSPEMTAMPPVRVDTWCYRDLNSPRGASLVFNLENVRPELAALVEADGTVTHGSLVKGKVTVHKLNIGDLNPLPVPLKEPSNFAPMVEPVNLNETELESVLRTLLSSRSESQDMQLSPGEYSGSVLPENLPWRGYWWSYKSNKLAGNYNSPLAKYDRYVKSRTGVMPRVQSWEQAYHKYKGISWEGHCNGWAASAVLRAEPNVSRIHEPSGIVFSVADQKGILAEEDYCATVAFYGRRNYGKPSNDPRDIYPAEFHRVITYYVGQLQKVVALDYFSSRTVDNHLISGYTTKLRQISSDTFDVVTNLTVHKYDSTENLPPGVAPTYIRTYKYSLKVNAFGKPIGGSWKSNNPDFLWVPLSPLDCGSNNPRMKQAFTTEILNLPPASTN